MKQNRVFLKDKKDLFSRKINLEDYYKICRDFGIKLEEQGWRRNVIEGGCVSPDNSTIYIDFRSPYEGELLQYYGDTEKQYKKICDEFAKKEGFIYEEEMWKELGGATMENFKKAYGSKYKYYHLEDVVNEYGKVVEQRIVENDKDNKETINLVFTKDDGKYVCTNITRYPYKIIHKELGIENCRFYDLRGSYATKILKNGVEIRDVADLLGHGNVETTENYYISSTENSKIKATNAFEEMIHSEIINDIIKYDIF